MCWSRNQGSTRTLHKDLAHFRLTPNDPHEPSGQGKALGKRPEKGGGCLDMTVPLRERAKGLPACQSSSRATVRAKYV